MPPTPKIHVALTAAVLKRFEESAAAAGLPVADYAALVLAQHAIGASPPGKRPVGRPITPHEDMPPGIERAVTVSGFVGVTKHGRNWQAKAGREAIGVFSSPELAAFARHFVLQGFYVGRGAYFEAAGMAPDAAQELARRAGFGSIRPKVIAPASPTALTTAPHTGDWDDACHTCGYVPCRCDDRFDFKESGSSAGPTPTEEPRETPAPADGGDGAMSTTSTESVAQMSVMDQVRSGISLRDVPGRGLLPGSVIRLPAARRIRDVSATAPRVSPRTVAAALGAVVWAQCPVCNGPMDYAVPRKHEALCPPCSELRDAWDALPPAGTPPEPAADGSYTLQSAPAAESFVEYVKRVRGL
jgi:hypothetical protein